MKMTKSREKVKQNSAGAQNMALLLGGWQEKASMCFSWLARKTLIGSVILQSGQGFRETRSGKQMEDPQ